MGGFHGMPALFTANYDTSLTIYEAFGRLSAFCPGCGSAGLPTHHQCTMSLFGLMFLCTLLHGEPSFIMTCSLLLQVAHDNDFI